VLLAERLDRGWAQGGGQDDRHGKAVRQIARGAEDAAGREAEGERAAPLTERLEALDREAGIGDRPTEAVIAEICRYLGLDPVRMTVTSPLPDDISVTEMDKAFPRSRDGRVWDARPPQRPPDG
jgi:hypothetical protein